MPVLVKKYRVVPKKRAASRWSLAEKAVHLATPLIANRVVFPKLLKRSLVNLHQNPGPCLPISWASAYFGNRLVFSVAPLILQQKLADDVEINGKPIWLGRYFLDGADWSGALQKLSDLPVYREMTDVVRFASDFRQSPSYMWMLRCIEKGRPVIRNTVALSTQELLDQYFIAYLNLLNSIRHHGLLPHSDAPNYFIPAALRPAIRKRSERNIGVAIGPDGELLRFRHGQHRTALAQLLGLPAIPVELRMVHTDWLKRQVARTKLPPAEALLAGLAEYDLQHRPNSRPELEQNQQPLQV